MQELAFTRRAARDGGNRVVSRPSGTAGGRHGARPRRGSRVLCAAGARRASYHAAVHAGIARREPDRASIRGRAAAARRNGARRDRCNGRRQRRSSLADARRGALQGRRARTQFHARAHRRPITVAELCKTLGVSRRTLQYTLPGRSGTEPGALPARAAAERRAPRVRHPPPATTVQDAAARWGFWHLGHFVTDYRHMFGELPSETLRGRWLQGRRRGTPSCS